MAVTLSHGDAVTSTAVYGGARFEQRSSGSDGSELAALDALSLLAIAGGCTTMCFVPSAAASSAGMLRLVWEPRRRVDRFDDLPLPALAVGR